MVNSFYLMQVFPLFVITLIFTTIILRKAKSNKLNVVVFLTGLGLFVIRPLLDIVYGGEIPFNVLLALEYLDLALIPGLILASIISCKLYENIGLSEKSCITVLLALIAVPLLYFFLYTGNIMLLIKIILISFANWIIWHALSDILAYLHVINYIKKGSIIVVYSKKNIEQKTFIDYIAKVYTLVFYGFSITTFIFSIFNVSFEGLEMSVVLARASWIVLLFSSVFLTPVKWLLDYVNLRAYNKENFSLEDIKVWSIIEEFAGITAIASFIILMYQLAGAFSEVIYTWRLAYTLTVLTLMAETPVVALPVLLYEIISLKKHSNFILHLIKPIPVSGLSELENLR